MAGEVAVHVSILPLPQFLDKTVPSTQPDLPGINPAAILPW